MAPGRRLLLVRRAVVRGTYDSGGARRTDRPHGTSGQVGRAGNRTGRTALDPEMSNALSLSEDRPKIVCLCGSTKFAEAFKAAHLSETMAGRIVLLPCTGVLDENFRDAMHKRRIDVADEVMIVNVGGYIGESTGRELAYARSKGKKVRFLESCPEFDRIAALETDAYTKLKSMMDHAADCNFCRAALGLT